MYSCERLAKICLLEASVHVRLKLITQSVELAFLVFQPNFAGIRFKRISTLGLKVISKVVFKKAIKTTNLAPRLDYIGCLQPFLSFA